jgi:hypothetical protein
LRHRESEWGAALSSEREREGSESEIERKEQEVGSEAGSKEGSRGIKRRGRHGLAREVKEERKKRRQRVREVTGEEKMGQRVRAEKGRDRV